MKRLWLILFVIPLFGQQTIGVIDFSGKGVSETEASALTDRFASELFKLNIYTLVERDRIGEILKEQGFQQSGCITSECAVEVGKMLGTELIITGSIAKVGTILSVNTRIIDVESSRILSSTSYDYRGDIGGLLTTGMKDSVKRLLGLSSSENTFSNYTPISPPSINVPEHTNTPDIEENRSFDKEQFNLFKFKAKTLTVHSPIPAEVYINDKMIGEAPIVNYPLPEESASAFGAKIRIKDELSSKSYFPDFNSDEHITIDHRPLEMPITAYVRRDGQRYENLTGFSIITPYVYDWNIVFYSKEVYDNQGRCTNFYTDEMKEKYGDNHKETEDSVISNCRDFRAPPGEYKFILTKGSHNTIYGSLTLDGRDREDTKILIYELEKSDYVIPDKYKKYITETDYYNMYETKTELYEDGSIKKKYTIKDGKQWGVETEFYPSGSIKWKEFIYRNEERSNLYSFLGFTEFGEIYDSPYGGKFHNEPPDLGRIQKSWKLEIDEATGKVFLDGEEIFFMEND